MHYLPPYSDTYQHIDKLEEARRVLGVSQLGLGVLDDLVPGEDRVLVPAQHRLHLGGGEGAQLVHREHGGEAEAEAVQLRADPSHEHPVQRPGRQG